MEILGLGGGGGIVLLTEDPLAHTVLPQGPVPLAESRVAAHQDAVAVLVAAVLLQGHVAAAYAVPRPTALQVVHSEPIQHVHAGVAEPLALDHRPVLVEVLDEVVAAVEPHGLLVEGGGRLRAVGPVQTPAPLVEPVELPHVGGDTDLGTQAIVALL